MRDIEHSYIPGISSQCDWLKALPLLTTALVYYLK